MASPEVSPDRAQLSVFICNPRGLHARPAAAIAKLVATFEADVAIAYCGERAEADSIMDLLMLGAVPGAQVAVSAKGREAVGAVVAVAALIERGFNEIPRRGDD